MLLQIVLRKIGCSLNEADDYVTREESLYRAIEYLSDRNPSCGPTSRSASTSVPTLDDVDNKREAC